MTTGVISLLLPLWSLWLARKLDYLYREQDLLRPNYRGLQLAPVLGPALLLGYLPALVTTAVTAVSPLIPLALAVLLLGTAFYGLWDDLLGGEERGFKGHLGALRQGRITAGQLKMMMATLSVLLFSVILPLGFAARGLALVLILFSANGMNLLDRRPGRALKVFFVGMLLLVFNDQAKEYWNLLVPLLVAALALAPLDLGARGLLGDCGSNLLGAALGAGAVLILSIPVQLFLLGGWVALHLYAEWGSVSDLVEQYPLLQYLDILGRWRENLF